MKSASTKRLRALVANDDWLGVGLELRRIQENRLHTGNFRSWVEKQDLGFSYRTGLFYVELTKDVQRLGYTEAQTRRMISELGVSKVSIIMRHLRKKQPAASVIDVYDPMSNPQIDALLKQDDKVNFHARISGENHERLMKLLEKHGAVNKAGSKARGSGPAFDAFLTRYFRSK